MILETKYLSIMEHFGPEMDEERPLREHLVELRKRLAVVIAAVLLAALASFPLSGEGLTLIIDQVSTAGDAPVAVYTPIEYVVVQIYFMLAVGLAAGLPLTVYEVYAFMAPGLYPEERRFYLLTVPASAILLVLGAALAWLVVVPELAPLLIESGEGVVEAAISIERIFVFVVGTMLLMGLVFQVPVIVALAVWSGATTPRYLLDRRLYAYAGFFFLTSVVTVDPTMASQLILTSVFVVLFEASVRAAARLTQGFSKQR